MIKWETYSDKIRQAVSSTLENITFSIVEDLPEDFDINKSAFEKSVVEVAINDNTYFGVIKLPIDYLTDIVTTLYTDSHTDHLEKLQEDTLNELTNTIFGTFLRDLEEEYGTFSLSIPHQTEISPHKNQIEFQYLLDDQYPIVIVISE